MSRVFLFDIDNTLLYTGGAGVHAMNLAFREMFGVQNGFSRVEFSGRTDLFIVDSGLTEHGIEGGIAAHLPALTSRYYDLLRRSVMEHDGYLMPGFPDLLAGLRDAGATLGLATGNFSEAAWIKLSHYGIREYFSAGGFGEVSLDRGEVVAEAIRRVADGSNPEEILVVGDTPHDVTSAQANGVRAIGVATGNYSASELKESGAHLVFEDFSDWRSVAQQILS